MSKNYLTRQAIAAKLGGASTASTDFMTKRQILADYNADAVSMISYGDYDFVADDDIVKKAVSVQHTVNVKINTGVEYIIVTVDGVDTVFRSNGSVLVDDGKTVYWSTVFQSGYEYVAPSRIIASVKYQQSGSFRAVNDIVGGGSTSFSISVNAQAVTQTIYEVEVDYIPTSYNSVGLVNSKTVTYNDLLMAPKTLVERATGGAIQAHVKIGQYYDASNVTARNITDTTTILYAYTLYGGAVVWSPNTFRGGTKGVWDSTVA